MVIWNMNTRAPVAEKEKWGIVHLLIWKKKKDAWLHDWEEILGSSVEYEKKYICNVAVSCWAVPDHFKNAMFFEPKKIEFIKNLLNKWERVRFTSRKKKQFVVYNMTQKKLSHEKVGSSAEWKEKALKTNVYFLKWQGHL